MKIILNPKWQETQLVLGDSVLATIYPELNQYNAYTWYLPDLTKPAYRSQKDLTLDEAKAWVMEYYKVKKEAADDSEKS